MSMNLRYVLLILILSNLVIALAQQDRGIRLIIKDPESGQDIQPYNDSWAILIGVDKYKNVRSLDYAVADALSMKKLLAERFGFPEKNIILLTNEQATHENIRKAFGSLYRVNADDRVVIFFAGHGETIDLATGGQMGFIIPVDGKAKTMEELYSTSISMQTVKELSSFISAKHVLFLIDACYGGLAATGVRSLSKETKGYIKKVTAARARQILTAGGRGEQVVERSEWGHSAFTFKLLDGLGRELADLDNDGIIRASELASYIQTNVSAITWNRQTPQFRSFAEDEGEFLFIPSFTQSQHRPGITPEIPVKENKQDKDIFDVSDIEREIFKERITKEKEKEEIRARLQELKDAFARVKAIHASLAESQIKIAAWRRFLSAFSEDIPGITEDDEIRNEAERRMELLKKGLGEDYVNSLGMAFKRIEPGQFEMGSNNYVGEAPAHKVSISRAFHLGIFEVTQSQWFELMGTNPSFLQGDELPVVNVSWEDVQLFISALNAKERTTKYRLPTEAEWEYACKLGKTLQSIESEAWYEGNSNKAIQRVGTNDPNEIGLFDMLGNVWEWCSDWIGPYDAFAVLDPQGPKRGGNRVIRGGGWDTVKKLLRVTARSAGWKPGLPNIGFRLVRHID